MLTQALLRLSGYGTLALMAAGACLAETTPERGVVFDRTFGSGWLSAVARLPDGGFAVAGRGFTYVTEPFPTVSQHPLVVRLGPDGRVRWQREFPDRGRGEAQGLQVIPGGGVRATGSAGIRMDRPIRRQDWMAEFDEEGRVTRDELLDHHRDRAEGKFIPITATTFAFYGGNALDTGVDGVDIIATDARGSKLWEAKMPDAPMMCEGVATADPDGNLVAVLGTALPDLKPDVPRFRSFDSRGQVLRNQPFSAFNDTCPSAIRSVPGGGFIVAGSRTSSEGPTGWVALLDATGALVWERLFGPAENAVTVAHDVAPAPDGSFVVAGCTEAAAAEGLAVRFSRAGDPIGERRFPSVEGVMPGAVEVAPDGTVVLAGVKGVLCGLMSGKSNGGEAWVTALTPESLGSAEGRGR